MDDQPALLLGALTARFAERWRITVNGTAFTMEPKQPAHGAPKRRGDTSPAGVVRTIERRLAEYGVARAELLPLRWHRDTDLTISAIQALDPWLKDGAPRVWREGFIPQPVVRFTGERGLDGKLLDGFLTSFVNLSIVQRVVSVEQHVALLDAWIGAFSATGLHAGRLRLHGDLDVWQRKAVAGITIHMETDGIGIGDAILLWNADRPEYMASDLGSGLERLRSVLTNESWTRVVFGGLAEQFELPLLDAIRTATLLAMSGIRPSSRGVGSALRRVLRDVPASMAASGLGRLVRIQRAYWVAVGAVGLEWPQVSKMLEKEIMGPSLRGLDAGEHRRDNDWV